jgi:hypothetical protein
MSNDMNSLMQKLAVSKQIMERHDNMGRGEVKQSPKINIPSEYQEPVYNIPAQAQVSAPQINEQKIMSSNLPDEIKRLMIENPIAKPDSYSATLPNEVIEGAAKLIQNQSGVQPKKQSSQSQIVDESFKTMIRNLVRDTVRDVIKEEFGDIKGMISESKATNETMKLSVGKHIFEGKITSIKKLK